MAEVDNDPVTLFPIPGAIPTTGFHASRRVRAGSALAAAGMVALFACVLVFGLRAGELVRGAAALVAVDLSSPQPDSSPSPSPRQRPRERTRAPAPEKAASPRNLRNQATQIVVPPAPIIVPPPPVITTARAGSGAAASNGASDLPGPGQGAGGIGDGLGGGGTGGAGDGTGGGGTGPRQIKGRLSYSDLPEGVLPGGGEVSVGVRYSVEADGAVGTCRAERSSGNALLDATVCRLIRQRFRFRPARDRNGQPVASTIVETHGWVIEADRNQPQR